MLHRAPGWLRTLNPSSRLICSADNGGDGGGGGAAAGGGDDDLDPKIRDLVVKTVNSAVSSQLGRKLPSMLGESLNPLKTQLEELSGKLTTGAGGKDAKDKGGGSGDDAGSERVKALEAQLEEMRNANKAEKEAREAERKAAQEQELTANLREMLTQNGVEALRVRGAIAVVREHIKRDDKGQPQWKAQREGYTEDLTLEKGLKEWLDSDEGKSYLAPKGGGGSGTRIAAGGAGGGGNARPTKEGRQQARREAREGLLQMTRQMLSTGAVDID